MFGLFSCGRSDKTWTSGLYHPNGPMHQGFEALSFHISEYRAVFTLLRPFWRFSCYPFYVHLVHNHTHYAPLLCTEHYAIGKIGDSVLYHTACEKSMHLYDIIFANVKYIFITSIAKSQNSALYSRIRRSYSSIRTFPVIALSLYTFAQSDQVRNSDLVIFFLRTLA